MHKQFKILGHHFDTEDLQSYAKQILRSDNLSDQEKNTFDFIQKWLDSSDSITVRTSGSTGQPKVIEIPKIWMSRSALATAHHLELRSGTRALLCLPSQYIGGMMMVVRSMTIGMDLKIIEPKIDLGNTGCFDFAAMIPLQVETILNNGDDLDQISKLIIGGAPISIELEQRLKDVPGEIYSTFGMTETVSHIALRRINGPEASSFYSTLRGITVETDETSKLIIRISHFDDLQIETNDIVELIDERNFKWKGRADNIINSGGMKIHPEELERELSERIQLPFFVTAEDHESLGEMIVLVVETDQPELIFPEIRSQLHTLGNRRPRKIYFTKEIIRTASGKMIRDIDKAQSIDL